jgi:hypothetical protein
MKATLVLEVCITQVLLDLESGSLFGLDSGKVGDITSRACIGTAELDTFAAREELELLYGNETGK